MLSTYATNITSGTSVTLEGVDFDTSFTVTKDIDFKIKVYLVGDSGVSTSTITEISGNYALATIPVASTHLNFSKIIAFS